MRLLLNTHTFLWFIDGDTALSPYARQLIEDRTKDYAPEMVTQTQAARALQRTRDFLAAIREKVNAHES